MGMTWAEHTVEIAGSPDECFDAIVDYETFPKWQAAVEKVEVMERDRKKLGKVVHLHVSAKGRKVDYVLDYKYDRPERIRWDFVEGNGVNDVDGEYTFKDLGDGRTLAKYKLGIEIGLPIPGAIAKRIHKGAVSRSVEDLKEEVERRNGGVAGAPAAASATGGGYGPLGVLGSPLHAAKDVAESAVGAATSVVERLGGLLGGDRPPDDHDE